MNLRAFTLASVLMLTACGGGNDEGGDEVVAGAESEGGEGVVATPADGYFPVEPGLWERTSVAAMGTAPAVERICIDASTRNRITPVNELRGIASGCKPVEQSEATMFGVTFRLQCADPAGEASGVLRFDEGELKTDISLNSGDDMIYSGRATAKRIGDCPAGMKPGDVAGADGTVTGSLAG